MTWTGPLGWLLIDQREFTGALCDAKSTHAARVFATRLLDFTDRIEKSSLGMQRQKAGVGYLRGQFRRTELSGAFIEMRYINSFALGTSIRADENQGLLPRRWLWCEECHTRKGQGLHEANGQW